MKKSEGSTKPFWDLRTNIMYKVHDLGVRTGHLENVVTG